MRTIRLVNGLAGKSSIKLKTGLEVRPDNIRSTREFFYIEVFNPGPFSACVGDVSLCWKSPTHTKTVKSIIVGEEKNYPVTLKAGVHWRIHLLPSLINPALLTGATVELTNGQKLHCFIDSSTLPVPRTGAATAKKWAGGLRLK
ncbi:MAG: hypothetical protein JWM68_5609 [Verrucomicrobiales bacterium]|nr:hypothetical protein [Verrucomicrobiales bacterium]